MSQSGGPGSGQPPSGPPDWRSAPQQPQAPAPPSWQSAPQAPRPAAAPTPPAAPQAPAAPAWQSAPQQPQAPASWQSAPKTPVPPNVPPPPSWTANLTSTVPVPGPAGFVYADVPNRIVAYFIDSIILFIIGLGTVAIIGGALGGVTNPSSTTDGSIVEVNYGASLVVGLIGLAISAAYFILMWSSQRATVGMKVLGLQIGTQEDGRSITTMAAFNRWLIIGIPSILAQFAGYLSAGLGMILGLVGIVWLIALLVSISQSPTKQGYHDRYAKTIMVKTARRAA